MNGLEPKEAEERMSLTLDSKTFQEIKRQQALDLRDHLSLLAAALKEIRAQKRLLRDQKFALLEQLHTITQQQYALSHEESTLLQEELAIVAQCCRLPKR